MSSGKMNAKDTKELPAMISASEFRLEHKLQNIEDKLDAIACAWDVEMYEAVTRLVDSHSNQPPILCMQMTSSVDQVGRLSKIAALQRVSVPCDDQTSHATAWSAWANDDGWLVSELRQLKQSFEHLQAEVAEIQSKKSTVVDFDMLLQGQMVDQSTMSELRELKQNSEHLQAKVAALQVKSALASESTSADVNVPEHAESVRSDSYVSDVIFNPYLEYRLGESVWDTSLVLGLPEVGPACSFFLGGVFLLNMFIQIFMVQVLLEDKEFNDPGAFTEMFEQMTYWRQTDGHDHSLENTDGVNLVNRVCHIDEALSIASLQLQKLKEINIYLKLDQLDLALSGGLIPGPILCMLCILILTLMVVNEFRQNFYFLLCISTLPKQRTNLKAGRFESLSLGRFIWIIILTCIRSGISLCLIYSGTIWLSSTSSMSNLILNAAVLGFVLEIDEVLFHSIVPYQVAALVGSVQPVRFNSYLYKMDALLPVSFAAATLVFAYWQHVIPNRNAMLDIKKAMCGPSPPQSLNFVVSPGSEQTEIIVSRYSTPFSAEGGKGAGLRRAMIELQSDPSMVIAGYEWGGLTSRLEMGEKVPVESMWVHPSLFSPILGFSMAQFCETYNTGCVDADHWWSFQQRELVYVQERIRRMADVHEELSPAAIRSREFFRCSDYAKYCDVIWDSDAELLRMLCLQTCGCDNPWSGLWPGAPGSDSGCPKSCGALRDSRFRQMSCVDFNFGAVFDYLILQNSTYAELINSSLTTIMAGPVGDDDDIDTKGHNKRYDQAWLDFVYTTEAHILDLTAKRLGKEFQTTAQASARLVDDPANRTAVGVDIFLFMGWMRYWKYVMLEVADGSWRGGLMSGCEAAVQVESVFDDMLHPWHPCQETQEMFSHDGATSLKSFCPATCYAISLEYPSWVNQEEFDFCRAR